MQSSTPPLPTTAPAGWQRWLWRAAAWAVLANVALAVLVTGWRFRQRVWVEAQAVQLKGEFDDEFRWGQYTVQQDQRLAAADPAHAAKPSWRRFWAAYVSVYPARAAESPAGNYDLDRAPLRLLVDSLWAWQSGGVKPKQWTYESASLPMRVNLFCQIASAAGAFFLVRHWVRRRQRRLAEQDELAPWRLMAAATTGIDKGTILGLLAASLMWMDPATVLFSQGYIGWDLWFVPLFLFAAWAASAERWVIAGALVAAGAMIEPKLLLCAPVLALWPLFAGRWGAFVRLVSGFALGAAAITSPWIMTGWGWVTILLAGAAVVGGAWLLHNRWPKLPLRTAVAVAIALAIWLAAWRFGGSMAWYRIAFEYPIDRRPVMAQRFAGNIPGLMKERYGWELRGPNGTAELARWAGPWASSNAVWLLGKVKLHSAAQWVIEGGKMPLIWLLRSSYFITLLLCGIGAAIHSRRNSPRILVALIAPYALMFAILGQLSDRDLVFAAALGAVAAGASVGMTLMWVVVSAMACGMMAYSMFRLSGQQMLLPKWWRLLDVARQGYGWMMVVVAGAYLAGAMMWEARMETVHRGDAEDAEKTKKTE